MVDGNVAPAAGQTAEAIQEWIVARLAPMLEVGPAEIDVHGSLEEYGLSSLDAVVLAGELEDWLGRTVPSTLAWEHPSVAAIAAYLAGDARALPG